MPEHMPNPPSFSEDRDPRDGSEETLRTMKSDIQKLFRDGKESLVSAVSKEVSAQRYIPPSITAPGKSRKKRTLVLVLIGIVLLAAVGASAYIAFFYSGAPTAKPVVSQATVPLPFFPMEKSRNIILKSFSFLDFPDNLRLVQNEAERDGTFKRIVVLVQDPAGNERLATAQELFLAGGITPSKDLLNTIGDDFNFFLYYQNGAARKGMAFTVLNETKAFRAMFDAESTLRSAWDPLYDPNTPTGTLAAFEDITYRNVDIRRLQLSEKNDQGFYYAIFKPKKLLVITTSYESMKAVLDRLFESF